MPEIPEQCDDGKTACFHRVSPIGCHSSWNGEGKCPDRKPMNSDIENQDDAEEFLKTHSKWLSENWSLSPEGREYNAKFKKSLDSLLHCNVRDSQGNCCPETPACIVTHNGKRTVLCNKCYQAWLDGAWDKKD